MRQYSYVIAVAEARSLTRAAASLNVSQPSLSVAITRVEDRLSKKLFVRSRGTAVELTPSGHRFVEKARLLLDDAAAIEVGDETSRKFTLGCFQDIAPWFLAPMLTRLSEEFPETRFLGKEERFAGLVRGMSEGLVDVAISYDVGFDASFGRRKLTEMSPVAFVHESHLLASRQSLGIEDLADHPLILSTEDLSERYVRKLLESFGITPHVVQRVASLEMMRSFAAHGVGIGISYSCPPGNLSYDGKQLVTIPINSPQAIADIVMLWHGSSEDDQLVRNVVASLTRMNRWGLR